MVDGTKNNQDWRNIYVLQFKTMKSFSFLIHWMLRNSNQNSFDKILTLSLEYVKFNFFINSKHFPNLIQNFRTSKALYHI
jgi:hypothetical protein